MNSPPTAALPTHVLEWIERHGLDRHAAKEMALAWEDAQTWRPDGAPAVQATADCIVQANIQCNACHRSLVGVTTGNAGTDTQCKPHGFECGLYGLKTKVGQATADELAIEILATEICAFFDDPGYVTAQSVADIIRKAVSPKAAAPEIPEWYSRRGFDPDKLLFSLELAKVGRTIPTWLEASCAAAAEMLGKLGVNSPAAVSGDKQEKERG